MGIMASFNREQCRSFQQVLGNADQDATEVWFLPKPFAGPAALPESVIPSKNTSERSTEPDGMGAEADSLQAS